MVRTKYFGARKCNQVYLPEEYIDTVLESAHYTYGHNTATQFFEKLKLHFHVSSLLVHCKNRVKRCLSCTELSPMSANKFIEKGVPVPSEIGQTILVDEVHRTRKGSSLRYLFASDCLSRYSKMYFAISGRKGYNAEKFIELMKQVKFDFMRENSSSAENICLQIRADACGVHTNAAKSPLLAKLGIKIHFHPSASGICF